LPCVLYVVVVVCCGCCAAYQNISTVVNVVVPTVLYCGYCCCCSPRCLAYVERCHELWSMHILLELYSVLRSRLVAVQMELKLSEQQV